MKIIIVILFLNSTFLGAIAQHEHSKDAVVPSDTLKKSLAKEEHQQIGDAHLIIKYHAPAVRGRTIWGGLVPYGEVWVAGAHSATSLDIDKDWVVNGKHIPAGKYAIFTIPGKEMWTIIINQNWNQHLADEYDTKDDLVRLEVMPQPLSTKQERLKYTIRPEGETKGEISIRWEKINVVFPFEIR